MVLAAAACGCGQAALPGDASVDGLPAADAPNESITDTDENTGAPGDREENTAGESGTATVEELREVMGELIESAGTVWSYFTCGGCPSDSEQPAPDREYYCLVSDERLPDMAALHAFTEESFTEACARRCFYAYLGEDVEYSAFLEIDGRLYALCAGKGWPYSYPADTLTILSQTTDTATVAVDRMFFEELEGQSIFVLKKTDAGWRLDNSFLEANDPEYQKRLG